MEDNLQSVRRSLDMRHAQRALRALTACNRALWQAKSEEEVLRETCRLAIEAGGYRVARIAYREGDAGTAPRVVAQAAADSTGLVASGSSIDETRSGEERAIAQAIADGRPHVARAGAQDAADPAASKPGQPSAIALPLRFDQRQAGALLVCGEDPAGFGETERQVLGALADSVSSAVVGLRERALQMQARASQAEAGIDALTGMPDRLRLWGALVERIADARQHNQSFPLLLLDVDRFYDVNEALGYEEGDRLLQQIGPRLRKAIPEADLVAYLGEDHFAVLVPRGDADAAHDVARRVLAAFADPFELSGFQADVRASIGISLFPGHGSTPDTLVQRADAAIRHAKRAHSGYMMYSGGAAKERTRRLALVGELKRAIEAGELRLYCQPKVDMRTNRVCGAEGLVRWQHARYGMIGLDELIPIAEQTGLIRALTSWLLGAASRQSHAWRESGLDMPIAVNVTMRNLREPGFIDRIDGLLLTWGTPPGALQIEITESQLMEDPAGTLGVLKSLSARGMKLFVDDFGTGYSSLAYLQQLPIDAIKIDQSFVRNMIASAESAKIVRSTVELAHSLDLEVVAEGVENEAIWERLVALGTDIAQGYHISRPIPAEEIHAWYAASPWGGAAAASAAPS